MPFRFQHNFSIPGESLLIVLLKVLLAIYLLKYSPWNVLEFNFSLSIASLPPSALWLPLVHIYLIIFFNDFLIKDVMI